MHEALQALLSLQEIDRDIYQVQGELRRLPAEREARRAQITKLETRLQEFNKASHDLRTRIKEIEDHTTQQRQRQRKVENEANSSRGDVALLAAFQHEIRSLKREISNAEEEGLELLEKAEEVEKSVKGLEAELEEGLRIFEEYSSNIEREMGEAQRRLDELEGRRQSCSASEIQPKDLDLYRRLLDARSGVAMAELEGRNCQGCFMQVPQNLCVRLTRGAALVQCPSCDRILFHRR